MAVDEFDYVVVGGGTAGAVVAARLSEDPSRQVCLIEAGPSDLAHDEVLKLRRWLELLGGPLDYGYRSTVQPNGNSHIVHSRARVLGGCSSHNTIIWFKPLPGDWSDWERRGAGSWDARSMEHTMGCSRTGTSWSRKRTGTRSCSTGWRRRPRRRTFPPTRTGTRPRSGTAPAFWTSAMTPRRGCGRRRASATSTRSWVAARTSPRCLRRGRDASRWRAGAPPE